MKLGRILIGTAVSLMVLNVGPSTALTPWSDFRTVTNTVGAFGVPAECDAVGFDLGEGIVLGDDTSETLTGTSGADIIYAGAGDDTLLSGDDPSLLVVTALLRGGGNGDCLSGEGGDDDLYGGQGDNVLLGGDGDDRLFDDRRQPAIALLEGGGSGRLYGGPGNDYLRAGLDTRALDGGEGVDTCSVPVVAALVNVLLPNLQLHSCENVVYEAIVGGL
jgi:Ca2+-binding RTX toxin-like protein